MGTLYLYASGPLPGPPHARTVYTRYARHRCFKYVGLYDFPRGEYPKAQFSEKSRQSGLGQAPRVYRDQPRIPAADIGLVGSCPAFELSRRPDDGTRVVPAGGVRPSATVFLHRVFYDPARPP